MVAPLQKEVDMGELQLGQNCVRGVELGGDGMTDVAAPPIPNNVGTAVMTAVITCSHPGKAHLTSHPGSR